MTSFVVLLHRLCIILKYLFKFDVYVLSPTKVKLKLWNRVLVIAELTGRLNIEYTPVWSNKICIYGI